MKVINLLAVLSALSYSAVVAAPQGRRPGQNCFGFECGEPQSDSGTGGPISGGTNHEVRNVFTEFQSIS